MTTCLSRLILSTWSTTILLESTMILPRVGMAARYAGDRPDITKNTSTNRDTRKTGLINVPLPARHCSPHLPEIPNEGGAIGASGGEGLAVCRPRQRCNLAFMSFQAASLLARGNVPKSDGRVAAY